MLELGIRVKDKVTGLEGIIVGRSQWLNGCRNYGVQSGLDKEGNIKSIEWIDELQLEILDDSQILKVGEMSGGPTPTPQRGY